MAVSANWHFAKHHPDQAVRNPTGGEFFSDDAVDRPAQALVREALQNSMDARVDEESVCVRIYLSGGRHALPAAKAEYWLGGAWPHLTAQGNGLCNVPPAPKSCPFIVVEDFGTTGLTGNPAESRIPADSSENRFFAFFRAEGVSSKEGNRGGRWGIGKTIFLRSSMINTLLALTVRSDDQRSLLMGRTVLKHHCHQGCDFTPDGWYGLKQLPNQPVLPVDSSGEVQRFVQDFHLRREAGVAGLSVVIPYCDPQITLDDFHQAVLREYFYPILAGKLTVILHDASNESTARLDAENLREAIGCGAVRIDAGLCAAIDLAVWSLGDTTDRDRITLNRAGESGPAEWSSDLIPPNCLDDLARRYRGGERLAIRVPLRIHRTAGRGTDSWFDLYVQQDLEDRGHIPFYIRNGIIIPKVRERQVRGHRILALLVVEDAGLGTPLGDAEPPSHTHWSAETEKFIGKYEYGRQLIDFVASAPRQIAELLSRAQEERDVYSLAQFFPHPGDEKVRPEPGQKPGSEPPPPPEPPPRSEPLLEIGQMKAGFSLSLTSKGRERLPDSITVRMAYDRESGNPIKKYSTADFVLDHLTVRLEHAEELARASNEIVLRPCDPGFRIEVTGFDPKRDVYVQALPSTRSGES